MTTDREFPRTADEALARLKEGNDCFVTGHARFPTVQKDVLAELTKGREPYATILGCSDSRVPPELVFDAGFGELFVIRVAGNVLGPSILGTLQYAATHLHPPFRDHGPRRLRRGAGGHRGAISRRGPQEAYRGPALRYPARARRCRCAASACCIDACSGRGERASRGVAAAGDT